MLNINPNFNGKFSLESDLVAYIDESGDESFNFNNSTTKWFVVSAIICKFEESNNMLDSIKIFRDKYKKNCSNVAKLTFKDLSHSQRRDVCGMLAHYNYLTTHSAFYKPEIDPNDKLATYPSMYFVGIKNLLERITWITKFLNKERTHILISNRNSIKSDRLKLYLFTNSVLARKNLSYTEKIGKVGLSNVQNHNKLLLADYTASSMLQGIEEKGEAHKPEPIYFDIFLKDKLYCSNHKVYGGVWNNGFKCTPNNKDLIKNSGILAEGTHKP